MDAREWVEAFAAAAGGVTLAEEDVAAVLELAGIAAHSSERMAAPLTCWIAGRLGLTPAEALAIARSLPGEG